jgi:hypothetical protein
MRNPFEAKPDIYMAATMLALSTLLDRAGGSIELDLEEFKRLEQKYGGPVGIEMRETGVGGRFLMTLVRREGYGNSQPGGPVS